MTARTRIAAAGLCLAFAAWASSASAHLAAGQDTRAGKFVVDIGYDPAAPRAGEQATLAFNLVKADTGAPVAPADVFVRVMRGDELTFAGTFTPHPENVTFSYAFPSAGTYAVLARFDGVDGAKDGIVEERLPIVVGPAAKDAPAAVTASPPASGPRQAIALAAALLLFEIGLVFGYTKTS